jgi:hypothetical protein
MSVNHTDVGAGGKDVMLIVVTDKKEQQLMDTKATSEFGKKVSC